MKFIKSYQRFDETAPFIFRNDGGSKLHRNIDIFLPDCAASLFPNAHTDTSLQIVPFCFALCQLRVGIMMGYGLDGRGSITRKVKRFFSSPQRLDPLCGPPSLIPNWYRGLFPRGKAVRHDHEPTPLGQEPVTL
jgi:hypothetical protein